MATSTMLSPSSYEPNMTFLPPPQSSVTSTRQRPKLSLNTTGTANKRSFGRGSTGLRLDKLNDASPTTRNTCQNGFCFSSDNTCATEGLKPKARKLFFPRIQTAGLAPSPIASGTPASAAAATPSASVPERSTTSLAEYTAELTSNLIFVPYALPVEARSILRNGPLSKRSRAPDTPLFPSTQGPASDGAANIARSPSTKKVCFRDPLEEDITNEQYLMRHSDLRSRSTSPALPSANGLKPLTTIKPKDGPSEKPPPPRLREISVKSRASAEEEDDEGEAPVVSKTPVAGRFQKDREWKWTLGPLPKLAVEGSAIFGAGSDSSEEDLEASLGESVAAASAYFASKKITEEEEDDD